MPDKIFYKAGSQDGSDPWEFTLSDPTRDSYGDIVEADWKLARFKKNPIALWLHSRDLPIGIWRNVRLEGERLRGRLELAAAGTSARIDELRSLVEAKILRAVSVGFRPGKEEPIDPEKPWNGYRLSENELIEASLVSVPANPNALNTKTDQYFTKPGELNKCELSAFSQLNNDNSRSRIYVPRSFQQSNTNKGVKMKLTDRIAQKQEAIKELQEKADALELQLTDSGGLTDEQMQDMEALGAALTKANRELKTLEGLEQARSGHALGASDDDTPEKTRTVSRIVTRQNRPKAHKAILTMAALMKSWVTHTPVDTLIAREAKDEDGLDILVRTAVAPAVTGTAAWAGDLVQTEWGEFIALLRDMAIYGRVPGQRVPVNASTTFPVQAGRGSLAGGFVAQNAAIPVKKGALSTLTMQPAKLAVISAFAKEMLRYTTVTDIGAMIRDQILADTAEAVDTALLSSTARTAGTTPAGVQDTTETGASNVNAVTNAATGAGGSTVAEIEADIAALLARVDAVRASATGAWVMNPKQVRALKIKQDGTTGFWPFKEEINGGTFFSYPIISSANVTDGIVVFVGTDSMVFGEDTVPMIEESTEATLHFEDTSPAAIGTAGTPTTVAAPVYSLFQQDLVGIKMTRYMDWRVKRQAGVQVLTAATGW